MSEIINEYKSLVDGDFNWISLLANTTAFIKEKFKQTSWVGFYLYEKDIDKLILGPFQGNIACYTIDNGKGVCGTALKESRTIIVNDVHNFKGHIACDSLSKSELVIPIINSSFTIGVLDLDSYSLNAFSAEDAKLLEEIISILLLTQYK